MPLRLLNSATVRSLVQQRAEAGVSSLPLASNVGGREALRALRGKRRDEDVGGGVEIALVVTADELAVLRERHVALLDARAHARAGDVALLRVLGELQRAAAAVADRELRLVEGAVGARLQLALEGARAHLVDEVVGTRADLDGVAVVAVEAIVVVIVVGARRRGQKSTAHHEQRAWSSHEQSSSGCTSAWVPPIAERRAARRAARMSAEDRTARWLACAGRATSLHGTRDKKGLAARPQTSRFRMQASRNDFAASPCTRRPSHDGHGGIAVRSQD